MKKTKRKMTRFLIKDLLEIKLKLPVWLAFLIVFLPIGAYLDTVIFHDRSFLGYFGVGFIEFSLIYLGFIIGLNNKTRKFV